MATSIPTEPSNDPGIDGLLGDRQWRPGDPLDYGFPTIGAWTGYTSGEEPYLGYAPITAAQQAEVLRIFAQIESFTNLDFVPFGGAPEQATLRFGRTEETDGAHAYLPFNHPAAGDVWFSANGDYDNPIAGNYAASTHLHEIGHALGLKHPHDDETFGVMPIALDHMNYTVMTYRSYQGMPVEAPFHNATFGFNQTYMMYDIAALQHLYGADFGPEARNGDSHYVWTPNSGNMTINGVIEHAPGANIIFLTVWDGGGNDTYDFSAYLNALVIRLGAGEWTRLSESQLADLGDNHDAMGNIANSLLYQGDERSLIENAVGGSGDDSLSGNQVANSLNGGGGNDWIDGGAGGDVMIGGAGDDRFFVDNAGDSVVEAAYGGNDRVDVSSASFVSGDNIENIYGVSTTAGQQLTGGATADQITGNNFDGNVLDGGGGNDSILGGTGTDTLNGGTGDDSLVGFEGADTINGGEGNDGLNGAGGNDILDGGAGDDLINGGGNDNLLAGGGGADMLEIRGGNDRILYLAVTDSTSAQRDRINGFESGIDKIDFSALPAGTLSWVEENDPPIGLAPGLLYSVVSFATASGTLVIRVDGKVVLADFVLPATAPPIVGTETDDQLFGTHLADEIIGNGGNDLLRGFGADDQLDGGAGNDRLEGGLGADAMTGGSGDDLFVVDDAGDTIVEAVGGGRDSVESAISFTLGAELENLILTGGAAAGTGNGLANTIQGNGADNNLSGADGDDWLDGGLGADIMSGGLGNDLFFVDDSGDQAIELAGQGDDEVRTNLAGYVLADNVERLTGLSGGGQLLTGNGLANILTAGTGADILNGAAGGDQMIGGIGDDTYFIDDAGDSVVEAPGAGTDTVQSLVSWALGDALENLTLIGSASIDATGNGLQNMLSGNSGNNVLDGGLGNDLLAGGLGDDVYVVDSDGDIVTEQASAGTDSVQTSVSYTLGQNLERLTAIGSSGLVLTGNALDNLIGGAAGNDRLIGGLGNDQLAGGLGDDVYVFDGVDVIVEDSGAGTDTVESALTVTLGANVENLILTGAAAVDGTGNGLANSLAGNASANTLDGMGGADAMAAGLGDDIYIVDIAGDSVTELASQGNDEIRTALAAYSLATAANVENLTGLSDAGQNLTGNGLANIIKGGWGNDLIDGGLGADDMRGSLGNDVYLVDNGGDAITEGDQQGLDEVRTNLSSFSLADLTYVENLTGGGGDQSLTGNGQNNVIDGGAGADTMAGGGGHDVYIVDNPGDVVVEVDGAGIDEVITGLGSKAAPERAVYVLPNFIENLTGTSAGAQGVRDNALNNIISMGAGHDLVVADAGGIDTINGGGGNDFIYYGDKWTAADITNGGAGTDTLGLIGNYASGIAFTATNLIGVERMALYTSLYLPGTGPNNYNVTMSDANVAAGTEFFVTAASLQSNESLTFNGSAETDGRFTVHGGAGNDTIAGGTGSDFFLGNAGNDAINGGGGNDFLYGGLGSDQLTGGSGFDAFRYQSAAQSTAASMDHIIDFTDLDRIDLSAIDANGNGADGNSAFTFIGSNAFGNVAGQLRAYQSGADWFVEGDVNGDGIADLVIQVTITDPNLLMLGASDFLL